MRLVSSYSIKSGPNVGQTRLLGQYRKLIAEWKLPNTARTDLVGIVSPLRGKHTLQVTPKYQAMVESKLDRALDPTFDRGSWKFAGETIITDDELRMFLGSEIPQPTPVLPPAVLSRRQLTTAYRAGLLTQEEYDHAVNLCC